MKKEKKIIAAIVFTAAVICFAAAYIAGNVIRYNYEKAERAKEAAEKRAMEIKQSAPTEIIRLGENGEAIEWQVLEKSGERMLVITRNVIAEMQFTSELNDEVIWENCTLRQWLNNDFYNTAFSDEEKARIIETELANADNPKYGTKGGSKTRDRIFLLSADEAERYFAGRDARNADEFWWLRSPGCKTNSAAMVTVGGTVSYVGYGVYGEEGVRPAMWITYK